MLVTLEPNGKSPVILGRPSGGAPYLPTDSVSAGTLRDLGCSDGPTPHLTGTGESGR